MDEESFLIWEILMISRISIKKYSSSLYAPGGLELGESEGCLQPASGGLDSGQGIPIERSCPSNWIVSFLDCWSCKVT